MIKTINENAREPKRYIGFMCQFVLRCHLLKANILIPTKQQIRIPIIDAKKITGESAYEKRVAR